MQVIKASELPPLKWGTPDEEGLVQVGHNASAPVSLMDAHTVFGHFLQYVFGPGQGRTMCADGGLVQVEPGLHTPCTVLRVPYLLVVFLRGSAGAYRRVLGRASCAAPAACSKPGDPFPLFLRSQKQAQQRAACAVCAACRSPSLKHAIM